jgi:hypothetical protein
MSYNTRLEAIIKSAILQETPTNEGYTGRRLIYVDKDGRAYTAPHNKPTLCFSTVDLSAMTVDALEEELAVAFEE